MHPEDQRTLLVQEWENFRFQDGLRWSRSQTIAAIEGGFLYAGYALDVLSGTQKLLIVILGSLLVAAYSILILKDGLDARGHLTRARALEPAGAPTWTGQALPLRLSGTRVANAAMVILNVFNLAVVLERLL